MSTWPHSLTLLPVGPVQYAIVIRSAFHIRGLHYCRREVTVCGKLQALVYDILPSTTAVFSYVIGSCKLSANEQFFVVVQTVVGLLQTTQIKQSVSFIAANKVYTAQIKNHNRLNRDGTLFFFSFFFLSFFSPGVDVSHVYVRVWALGCFHSHNY